MGGVLLRYRVMAFTTATLLIVLVFVGIPLQVAAGEPEVVNDVGTLHGFLYIVYLLAAFQLTRRLHVPKWQMLLVLLAGTVPFCAFVAERKMTRRFETMRAAEDIAEGIADASTSTSASTWGAGRRSSAFRRRWLSPRALALHVEVLVVAPGCVVAGWWQATRALAGNELSWVYSIEWPIFALLAILGWWHLVHEDPEAYRARRWLRRRADEAGAPGGPPSAGALLSLESTHVEALAGRWSAALAAGVGFELLVGIVSLVLIPFGRSGGWVPVRGAAVYGVHASLGLLLGIGAIAFVMLARRMGRIARIAAWGGAVSIAFASAGGLMTEPHSLVRFLGVAVMFVGSVLAGCAYLMPIVLRARAAAAVALSRDGARDPVAGDGAATPEPLAT